MRILIVSNAPHLPTAYAGQTALLVPRLIADGHEVTIFATAGCDGASQEWRGVRVLPRVAHPFGADVVEGHAERVGADLVLTLLDPHVLDPVVYGRLPWCAWAPVDCSPVGRAAADALRAARWVWTPSQFGVEQLRAADFGAARYVPHGVDSRVFSPHDREAARVVLSRACGTDLSGKFLVVMNAANREDPPRKGFYEAFQAFALFAKGTSNVALYVHSEARGALGGVDLASLARGVSPWATVAFAPQYEYATGTLDAEYLATAYSTADAYLTASHGEGFGLPVVEAAMCGCPVVAPDNTSHPEVAPAGLPLAKSHPYTYDPAHTGAGQGVQRYCPSIADLARGLEQAHVKWGDAGLRALVRESVLHFDADRVYAEYVKPAVDAIAEEISR